MDFQLGSNLDINKHARGLRSLAIAATQGSNKLKGESEQTRTPWHQTEGEMS